MKIFACDKCETPITDGFWVNGNKAPTLKAHTGVEYHYCHNCYHKVFKFLTEKESDV